MLNVVHQLMGGLRSSMGYTGVADIDALRTVSEGINALRSPDSSILLITHYQRMLNYITPDVVHVLYKGRIVRSGGKELALELEAKGYDWITNAIDAEEGSDS